MYCAKGKPDNMRRDFLVCLSLANLSFWYSWCLLLYTDTSQYYYLEFPPDATFACMVILEVLLFAVLCWRAIIFARRFDNSWLLRMAKCIFMLGITAIVFSMRWVGNMTPLLWIYALWNKIGSVALSAVASVVCLSCVFLVVRKFNSIVKASVVLVLIFSPFVVVTFFQAGMFVIRDLMSKSAGGLAVSNVKKTIIHNQSLRRVVWIIFDEMDQRLSFVERPDYVHLPHFDRLRQEGLYALNAHPPYHSTLESLPALLTGRLISRAVPLGLDDLEITYLDAKMPVSWKDQPNLFSMAKEMSLNAAGGGYGHPYCRLFGDMLTSCFSYSHSHFEWKGRNLESNLLDAMLAQIFPLVPIGDRYNSRIEYLSMLDYAKKVAVDERLNLIFLHFRIPHAPYIYNMEKEEFSVIYDFVSSRSGKGYFSNLVLADITLGEIREVLESTDLWKKTTLIVSSDHWWRRHNNTYDGKVDKRVPFILKLAEQSNPVIYEPEFNTVLTYNLVLATLDGRVSTISDVVNWLDEHRNTQPIYGAIPDA
jgi:hypothetical protein